MQKKEKSHAVLCLGEEGELTDDIKEWLLLLTPC